MSQKCYNTLMVIQYFGLGMVKVSLGDEVLCFAPISKTGSIKGPSFGSNVAFVPVKDKNFDGVEQVTYGSKEPFVVDGPGEYEINGTFVRGIASVAAFDKINTIYSVLYDDVRMVHLGAHNESTLTAEAKEIIGDVDVLFVPCYGESVLDAAGAYKVASALNPKIIIPLYQGAETNALSKFFKESGEDAVKPIDKLVLKKKDVEGKDGEIVPIMSA